MKKPELRMPGMAPEVTRLQAQEAQLSTRVTTMRYQETKLQGQLPNLRQEDTRINALIIQIRIKNSSTNSRNQELTQTANLEISHLQTGVF